MHRSLKSLSGSPRDQAVYLVLTAALYPLFLSGCALRRFAGLTGAQDRARSVMAEAGAKTSVAVAHAFLG